MFDYIKARDKYLVADALDRIGGLQAEFSATWEQYFRIPLESKEKIEWDIISSPIALKSNVNENLLTDEFGSKFTDAITVYDFLNVIDTDTFNKIPNQEIKDEISKLIKKTLEIAKENNAIGKEDPNKVIEIKEPISAVPISVGEEVFEKALKLSNLKKGDRFTFPLSQEDKDMGVSEMIYVFDSKAKSTFYYKSGDSEFSTSENREVNLLSSKEPVLEKTIEKSRKSKKTQEQIFKEIEEVDPEYLLSLLDEI